MPPKPKYTKEEIITAAFELVREAGSDALTAREVGKHLATSSSPIFTVFRDMDELRDAVRTMAKARFDAYMAVAENYVPAYKMRGMQWVKFATAEPQLFRLLFMQHGDGADFDRAMGEIPFSRESDIAIIMRDYHASREAAEHLFRQMWTYTYGLCALSAAGVCTFTEDEIAVCLGEIFRGMVYVLQNGNPAQTGLHPTERGSAESEKIAKGHPNLGEKR